jgi:hypothetical protein
VSHLAHTRPRRATEILDSSFQYYRAHFADLLVLSALLLVPPILIGAFMPPAIQVVFQLVFNLMFLVCQGAVAVLVAGAIEQDRSLSAGEVLRRLGDRAGSVIAVSIMCGILIGLGALFLVIPGILIAVWTAVATPVVAIEGLKNSTALSRSRDLVRGHFWHVFGTMALAWIIVFALVFGLALALGLGLGVVGAPERLVDMLFQLVMVPLFPLIAITASLLYYDLRVRSEAADVSAMIDALPTAPSQAS